jgi:hypothetical protein
MATSMASTHVAGNRVSAAVAGCAEAAGADCANIAASVPRLPRRESAAEPGVCKLVR